LSGLAPSGIYQRDGGICPNPSNYIQRCGCHPISRLFGWNYNRLEQIAHSPILIPAFHKYLDFCFQTPGDIIIIISVFSIKTIGETNERE